MPCMGLGHLRSLGTRSQHCGVCRLPKDRQAAKAMEVPLMAYELHPEAVGQLLPERREPVLDSVTRGGERGVVDSLAQGLTLSSR